MASKKSSGIVRMMDRPFFFRNVGGPEIPWVFSLGGTVSSNRATWPSFIRGNRLSHSLDNRFIAARKETKFLICWLRSWIFERSKLRTRRQGAPPLSRTARMVFNSGREKPMVNAR